MFFVLIHDYTLCFTGPPYCIFSYCKFSYYNNISIWPYYIVIHLKSDVCLKWCGLLGEMNCKIMPQIHTQKLWSIFDINKDCIRIASMTVMSLHPNMVDLLFRILYISPTMFVTGFYSHYWLYILPFSSQISVPQIEYPLGGSSKR